MAEEKARSEEAQESYVSPHVPALAADVTSSTEQLPDSAPVDRQPFAGVPDSISPETTAPATEGTPPAPLTTEASLENATDQAETLEPTSVEQEPVAQVVDQGMEEQDVQKTDKTPPAAQDAAGSEQSAVGETAALPTESNDSPSVASPPSADDTTKTSLKESEKSQGDGHTGLGSILEVATPGETDEPQPGPIRDAANDPSAPTNDETEGQIPKNSSEVLPDNAEQDLEESKDTGSYMPLVLPTSTYQPPAPSLFKHTPKSSMSAGSAVSKLNQKSFRRSEGPASLLTSITSPSFGKKNRSPSVASSGASTIDSNHSATIQIPEPHGQPSRSKHTRDKSDPKYLRFLSTVSDSQKKTEPERYVGYPGLVSHMTETQSLIFRRFDAVHVRLLLYLQDQISQLEARLKRLDEMNTSGKGIHNGTFRDDTDPYRLEIMERLRILVGEYDIMILTFSKMQEVRASDKAVARVKDWLKKYTTSTSSRPPSTKGGPIAKDELEWLEKSGDLSNLAVGTATVTSRTTAAVAVPDSPAATTPMKAKQLNRKSTLTRLLTGKRR